MTEYDKETKNFLIRQYQEYKKYEKAIQPIEESLLALKEEVEKLEDERRILNIIQSELRRTFLNITGCQYTADALDTLKELENEL